MGLTKWGLIPDDQQPSARTTVLARYVLAGDVKAVTQVCARTDALMYYRLDPAGRSLGRALSHAFRSNADTGHELLAVLVESGVMWPDVGVHAHVRRAMAEFMLTAPYQLVCRLIVQFMARLPKSLIRLMYGGGKRWHELDTRTLEEVLENPSGAPSPELLIRATRVPSFISFINAAESAPEEQESIISAWEAAIQQFGPKLIGVYCGFAMCCPALYRRLPRGNITLLHRFLSVVRQVTVAFVDTPEHAMFCDGAGRVCNAKHASDPALMDCVARSTDMARALATCGLTVDFRCEKAKLAMVRAYDHIFKPLSVPHPYQIKRVSRVHAAVAEGASLLDGHLVSNSTKDITSLIADYAAIDVVQELWRGNGAPPVAAAAAELPQSSSLQPAPATPARQVKRRTPEPSTPPRTSNPVPAAAAAAVPTVSPVSSTCDDDDSATVHGAKRLRLDLTTTTTQPVETHSPFQLTPSPFESAEPDFTWGGELLTPASSSSFSPTDPQPPCSPVLRTFDQLISEPVDPQIIGV
jgi:hypothetical protein